MSSKPTVIIIQGHPCTGKTFLMKELHKELGLPYLSRDEIKELLFDELGTGDRDWSMKLGQTSYSLVFHSFEKLLAARSSLILESNFEPLRNREKIRTALETYGFNAIELFLWADPQILMTRFKKRWESGTRHKGHVDHERYADLAGRLENKKLTPLEISKHRLTVDTTDFETVDLKNLVREIRVLLA